MLLSPPVLSRGTVYLLAGRLAGHISAARGAMDAFSVSLVAGISAMFAGFC